MAFISIEDVTVQYPLQNKGMHTVLSHLNLEIEQGEFVSIVGETGCGKSTLLRLLLGSEKPEAGRIVVAGKEVNHPSRDRGYVPQKYSLFPDKTVIRNVAFGPVAESFSLLRLLTPDWWKKRASVYLEAKQTLLHVGLLERDFHKYPDQLSGGMQQRVAIAQSLVMHPEILLMDESFSALDPNTRLGMQRLIRSIWQESGMTVVFVTHNLSEAVHLGNRILQIAKTADGLYSEVAMDIKIATDAAGEREEIMRRLDAGHHRPLENLAEVSR
jgi:NitT/TauT family transport system ATP-binding protein